MSSYLDIIRKKRSKNNKVITEKEFLESEKNEKILENLDIEHEEDKNSN